MNTNRQSRREFFKTIGVGAASLAISGCESMGEMIGRQGT